MNSTNIISKTSGYSIHVTSRYAFLWMCSGAITDLKKDLDPHNDNILVGHGLVCTGCYGNSFCEELCHNNLYDILDGLDGYGTCNLDTIYALESYQAPDQLPETV